MPYSGAVRSLQLLTSSWLHTLSSVLWLVVSAALLDEAPLEVVPDALALWYVLIRLAICVFQAWTASPRNATWQ